VTATTNLNTYYERIAVEREIHEILTNYNITKALIGANDYISARNLPNIRISDAFVWNHLRIGKNANLVDKNLDDVITTVLPEAIICSANAVTKSWRGEPFENKGFIEIQLKSTKKRNIFFILEDLLVDSKY
jgi:hypothetical protein